MLYNNYVTTTGRKCQDKNVKKIQILVKIIKSVLQNNKNVKMQYTFLFEFYLVTCEPESLELPFLRKIF